MQCQTDVHAHLLCKTLCELGIPVSLSSTEPVASSKPMRHQGKLLSWDLVCCCCIGCIFSIWPHGAVRAVILKLLEKLLGESATFSRVPLTPQLFRPTPVYVCISCYLRDIHLLLLGLCIGTDVRIAHKHPSTNALFVAAALLPPNMCFSAKKLSEFLATLSHHHLLLRMTSGRVLCETEGNDIVGYAKETMHLLHLSKDGCVGTCIVWPGQADHDSAAEEMCNHL